jgi:hypothetical protein
MGVGDGVGVRVEVGLGVNVGLGVKVFVGVGVSVANKPGRPDALEQERTVRDRMTMNMLKC